MTSSDALSSAPPRGMRDFTPADVALRDWAQAVIVHTYERFGFTRIETPVLEHINLLRRGEGGENLQLIFEVLKRGDKLDRELQSGQLKREDLADLGMRFDLTVPLVRFYAHHQSTLPNPLKSIQIGSVFRAESPQAGRFRQFTQCDIDILGVKSEIAEMELIQATATALLGLGLENFTIRINDRRILTEIAEFCEFSEDRFEAVFIALDKLDKIGLEGVRKELHTVSHSGDATDRLISLLQAVEEKETFSAIKDALPKTTSTEVFNSIENVVNGITEVAGGRYNIKLDPTLVRGMGYYTGQIFEISAPGYSHSIAGGGRYDKMVGRFAGRETPACGFSIGFERIVSMLTDKGFKPPVVADRIALICEPERDSLADVFLLAERLRSPEPGNEGEATSRPPKIVSILARKKDMKKHLDQLVAQGYGYYCVFRSDVDHPEIKQLQTKS